MSATRSIPIPLPRSGVRGAWDRFVGPGASAWENAGTLGFKLLLGHGTPQGPRAILGRRRQAGRG